MREGSSRRKLLLQQKSKRQAAQTGCDKNGQVERKNHRVNRANACKQIGYAFTYGTVPTTPHLHDRTEGNPRYKKPGQVDQGLANRIDLMPMDQAGQGEQRRGKRKTMETRAGASLFWDSPLAYILMPMT